MPESVMDDELKVGWNPVPGESGHFRYWNGRRWTGTASRSDTGGVMGNVLISGRGRIWHSFVHTTVIFHVVAWLNCSVPGVRGRLDRFQQPHELRTLRSID